MSHLAIIIPESGFCPPRGGGALRIFHLLRELSRHFQVHAISGQSTDSLRSAAPPFQLAESIRFHSPTDTPPPRDAFDLLPARFSQALRYRWHRRSLRGPANSTFLSMLHLLDQVCRTEKIDAILFEHLEAMTLAPVARRIAPGAALILDAHNVDHRLMEQKIEEGDGSDLLRKEAARVRETESQLSQEVDAYFACSDEDRALFEKLNSPHPLPGFTIPNGVDLDSKPCDDSTDKRELRSLLFCGSLDYAPNRDGLTWFHETTWPLIRKAAPELRLRVVGRGDRTQAAYRSLANDESVDLVGEVEDLESHYNQSSLSLVPLRMGSGTRLKILEAMAYGCPVVSTTIGAEGIDYRKGEEIQIADSPAYIAEKVERLLSSPSEYDRQRIAARKLVEERYDWKLVGESARDAILTLIKRNKEGSESEA